MIHKRALYVGTLLLLQGQIFSIEEMPPSSTALSPFGIVKDIHLFFKVKQRQTYYEENEASWEILEDEELAFEDNTEDDESDFSTLRDKSGPSHLHNPKSMAILAEPLFEFDTIAQSAVETLFLQPLEEKKTDQRIARDLQETAYPVASLLGANAGEAGHFFEDPLKLAQMVFDSHRNTGGQELPNFEEFDDVEENDQNSRLTYLYDISYRSDHTPSFSDYSDILQQDASALKNSGQKEKPSEAENFPEENGFCCMEGDEPEEAFSHLEFQKLNRANTPSLSISDPDLASELGAASLEMLEIPVLIAQGRNDSTKSASGHELESGQRVEPLLTAASRMRPSELVASSLAMLEMPILIAQVKDDSTKSASGNDFESGQRIEPLLTAASRMQPSELTVSSVATHDTAPVIAHAKDDKTKDEIENDVASRLRSWPLLSSKDRMRSAPLEASKAASQLGLSQTSIRQTSPQRDFQMDDRRGSEPQLTTSDRIHPSEFTPSERHLASNDVEIGKNRSSTETSDLSNSELFDGSDWAFQSARLQTDSSNLTPASQAVGFGSLEIHRKGSNRSLETSKNFSPIKTGFSEAKLLPFSLGSSSNMPLIAAEKSLNDAGLVDKEDKDTARKNLETNANTSNKTLEDNIELPEEGTGDNDPFTLSARSANIGRELGINAYSAVLDPKEKTGLYAQVAFPVLKIWKKMGDRFNKGDLLIQLEDSVAKSNYDKAVAALDESISKFTATGELYKSELSSLFDLKEAEAQVAKAKAELTLAETNFNATQIIAPYSGIVDTLFISEYELPQAGKEMIKILNDDVLVAKILVPSKLLPFITIGTKFFIHLSEIDEVIEAQISRIGGMIDPASSTLKIEAEIDNRDNRLKAGISGIATFNTPLRIDMDLGK